MERAVQLVELALEHDSPSFRLIKLSFKGIQRRPMIRSRTIGSEARASSRLKHLEEALLQHLLSYITPVAYFACTKCLW